MIYFNLDLNFKISTTDLLLVRQIIYIKNALFNGRQKLFMKDKHFGNFVCNWPSFVKHLFLLHSYTFREYSFSLNVEIRFIRARKGGKIKIPGTDEII